MDTVTTERPAPRRRFRLTEVLLLILLLAIGVFLGKMLLEQLHINNEVHAAKTVSNRVIQDIKKQDAADARKLGDAGFQKAHSETEMTALFKQAAKVTHGNPVIDKQIVNNDKYGQAVGIIYRYPGKPVYYVRIVVTKPKGANSWHMTSISGNTTEAPLLK